MERVWQQAVSNPDNVDSQAYPENDIHLPESKTSEDKVSKLPLFIGGGIAIVELIIGAAIGFIIERYPHCKLSTWMGSFV